MDQTKLPLVTLFAQITKQYIGAISERLSHFDIDRHFYLMYLIHISKEPLTQKELGNLLQQDKSAMVRIIDYLSEKGYVNRRQNPDDRRAFFVTLTAKAEESMPEIIEVFKSVDMASLDGLNAAQRQMLDEVLVKMLDNLNNQPMTPVKLDYKRTASKQK